MARDTAITKSRLGRRFPRIMAEIYGREQPIAEANSAWVIPILKSLSSTFSRQFMQAF